MTVTQKSLSVAMALLCVIGLLCSATATDTATPSLNLTPEERQWLSEHPVIRFAPDPDFPPIEWIDDTGTFKGVASDYIALAEQMLGVRFEMVRCSTWEDVLREARNGDIDVLSAAAQSEERSTYLHFTRPHIVFPAVIICRQDVDADLTLDDLRGMKVAVVAGYVWEEFLGRDYPDLVLDRVPDVNTGLRKVSFGLADAMVANLATSIHYIEDEGITNLRVAGETGYLSKLSFATRRDWPELHGLLTKVVDAIDEEQRDAIRHTWVRGITSAPAFNRTLLIALGISALVTLTLSVGIMGWNRTLKKQVDQRTEELQKELAERKRAEESLRLSEHKYRELVENANSIILRIDAQGRITFFNEYAQSFFGYTADEVLGKDCIGLIVPETDSTTGRDHGEMMDLVRTTPQEFAYNENENMSKNGERVWVAWSNRPIYDETGALSEVLCVGSDMTDRKRAEQERRQNELKLAQADRLATLGTLVSGIAHEINNPTNYISLNNENLQDIWQGIKSVLDAQFSSDGELLVAGLPYEEVRAETDRLIGAIAEGTQRIKAIVKGLKEFAGHGPQADDRLVDLNEVVQAAQLIVGNSIKKVTDAFSLELADNLPPVRGSFQAIEQVAVNLITNACHALPDKSRALSVGTFHDSVAGQCCFSVRDEGSGIPKEALKRIFDPFYTTKREIGGTGLGLSVSYSIVKEHKGTLTIESTEGAGTVATAAFPACDDTERPHDKPSELS